MERPIFFKRKSGETNHPRMERPSFLKKTGRGNDASDSGFRELGVL